MMRAEEQPKEGRLNLLIDPDLKTWIKEYARRRHTNVTNLIVAYFVSLREREEAPDVEQI